MKTLKNILLTQWNFFRNKSYFKQVLLSYISVSCVTFLVFSILLLTSVEKQNYQSLLEFNEQNITQATSFNNTTLADISNYCFSMLEDATIRKLLYSGTYDIPTAIASRDAYDSIAHMNSMITSLDFINFRTRTVLTKIQRMTLDKYYDQELLAYIDTLKPNRSPFFFLPRETNTPGNQKQTSRVLSIIYYSNKNGALVVNLDYNSYTSQINLSKTNENMEVILLNRDHLVMAATDSSLFMQDFSKNPLLLKVKEQPRNRGTFVYSDKTGEYDVSYQQDARMGITYLSILKRGNGYFHDYLFIMILTYSIVYILVTLLLSFFFSQITYRPIRKLKTTVTSTQSEHNLPASSHGDFEFLESAYTELITQNSALSRTTKSYENHQLQKKLKMLLELDDRNNYMTNDELEVLDSYFPDLNYLICIAELHISATEQTANADIPLMKFIIENIMTELFSDSVHTTVIETNSSKVVFLLNFKQYQKDFLKSVSDKTQEFLARSGYLKVSFGFGTPITDPDALSVCYKEAQIALTNGMLLDYECIQFYDELIMTPVSEQKYPYEADLAIINAIKAASKEALDIAINTFFDTICHYRYSQLLRNVQQLHAALQRFEYTNEITGISELRDIDPSGYKNLKQLRSEVEERCFHDLNALQEIKLHSHSKDELMMKVHQIIDDNIFNSNLSVMMIAEEVDLSINYLRNIYKENTGESLSSYITGKKLDIICHMLADTDTSIQDISDKLGFATKNYFFTFFKKHMNMTPTQYRSSFEKKKG